MRLKNEIVITDYQDFYRVFYLNLITGTNEMADFHVVDTPEEALSKAITHATKYLGILLSEGIQSKIRFVDFDPKDIPLSLTEDGDYYEIAS